jgi:hypothetical protein
VDEREGPDQAGADETEPTEPKEPSPELAPPLRGSTGSPTKEAADNQRGAQRAAQTTRSRVLTAFRSLWPRR